MASLACNLTLLGRDWFCSTPARRSEPVGQVEPGGGVGADPFGVDLLELDRDVADRGVQAAVVEPAHPLDDRQLCLGDRAPGSFGDQLGLEGVDEALGQGVVIRIADRAQGAEDVVVVEGLGELRRCVLGAAV